MNSDDAVSILMLHHFRWPEDLYFWGQDRYGSLVPLLGQILFKWFSLSAITAESITHYAILTAGYFGFAVLFRSVFAKLLFAVVWFFPPMRMIDHLHYNIGIAYSLLGIAVYCIHKLYIEKQTVAGIRRHTLLLILVLAATCAVWVSDLMAVSLVVILVVILAVLVLKIESGQGNQLTLIGRDSIVLVPGLAFAVVFIIYAKQHATPVSGFSDFNSLHEAIKTSAIFLKTLTDIFLFKVEEPLTGIYGWLAVLTALAMIVLRKNSKPTNEARIWLTCFLVESIVILAVILFSKWTLMNGVPRRYFVSTYVSLWLVAILALDSMKYSGKNVNVLKIFFMLTVAAGAVSTPYNLKYIWPETLTPRAELSSKFKALGNIGVIGDYWNSYIVSCIDPDNIVATPHETAGSRNPEFTRTVFEQDALYLIKDMWMKEYPDTLMQYGRTLIKSGDEFIVGDSNVCRYEVQ